MQKTFYGKIIEGEKENIALKKSVFRKNCWDSYLK